MTGTWHHRVKNALNNVQPKNWREIELPTINPLPDESPDSKFAKAVMLYRTRPDNVGYDHLRTMINEYLEKKEVIEADTMRKAEIWLEANDPHGKKHLGLNDFSVASRTAKAPDNLREMVEVAETMYARAIYYSTKEEEYGEYAKECRSKLPKIRNALAEIYARCDVENVKTPKKHHKSELAKKMRIYKDYMERGTLSAYMINTLKETGVIDDKITFGQIVHHVEKPTTINLGEPVGSHR